MTVLILFLRCKATQSSWGFALGSPEGGTGEDTKQKTELTISIVILLLL